MNTIKINSKYNGNLYIVFHTAFLPNSCMNSLKMFLIYSFKITQFIVQLFMYKISRCSKDLLNDNQMMVLSIHHMSSNLQKHKATTNKSYWHR